MLQKLSSWVRVSETDEIMGLAVVTVLISAPGFTFEELSQITDPHALKLKIIGATTTTGPRLNERSFAGK